MRRILLIILFALSFLPSYGAHLVGGEISYQCNGTSAAGNNYIIRLVVYRDCNSSGAPFDNQAPIAIYGGPNQTTLVTTITPGRGPIIQLPAIINNPCLQAPPNVCTEKATYTGTVTLPPSTHGYTIVHQRCCRNQTISNVANSGSWGNTYHIGIPPLDSACNSSARFQNDPPIVMCKDDSLNVDFSVTEPDGDSVFYSLCQPLNGGSQNNPSPNPPGSAPFTPVPYVFPYNTGYPLPASPGISVDPNTGILRGTPSGIGQYVFAVCAEEYDSNGVLLSTLRRDYQFNVTNCQSVVISNPTPQIYQPNTICNGRTVRFLDSSYQATDYLWLFNDPNNPGASSTNQNPQYTYLDTGTYTIQLVINPGWPCTDTAEVVYELYNPVNPNFTFNGKVCFDENLINFQNQSSNGGNAVATWDFGPNASIQNYTGWSPPAISFSTWGDQIVTLHIEENGCEDTFTDTVRIYRRPATDVHVEAQIGCAPFEVTFWDSTITDGAIIYNWDFGDGVKSNDSLPTYTYDNPGTYDLTLTIYFIEGCVDTITIFYDDFITVYPSPTSAMIVDPTTATIYTSNISVTDQAADPTDRTYTYMGDGSLYTNVRSFVHSYSDTGWFEVEHVVVNTYDCPDTSRIMVRIDPETLIFIPNAFTPNNDGENDTFYGTAVGVNSFLLQVFSRWGELVFETTDPAVAWDGTYPYGNDAPVGTYTWKVFAQDKQDRLIEKTGRLNLLR